MDHTLTLKELATALDLHESQLCRESKRPGFPVGPGRRYNSEEVRTWRAINIHKRAENKRTTSPAGGGAAAGTFTREPLAAADDPFIVQLESGTASPLDIARAAVQLCSRKVARSAVAGTLSVNDLDDLKKSLAELRQAEQDYIEIGRTRGELVELETVREVAGSMATRLVRAFDAMELRVTSEIEVWFGDPAFARLPADERRRKVRQFINGIGSEVRRAECDQVETLIAQNESESAVAS